MLIKIGDKLYSSEDQPIMLLLTDQDKENLKNMSPTAHKYCEYMATELTKNDGPVKYSYTKDEILIWMNENIPDEFVVNREVGENNDTQDTKIDV